MQQAELVAILDNLKTNGYNTVFLQVRSEGDAMYPSTIEPWSQWLTGTQGLAPNPIWDPLAFAVTEAHNRGLELHAWLNPYRVQTSSVVTYPRAVNHVVNENPSWIMTATRTDLSTNNIRIMDPGIPNVRAHIVQVVQEIANNYNLDGIHFDDYFYSFHRRLCAQSVDLWGAFKNQSSDCTDHSHRGRQAVPYLGLGVRCAREHLYFRLCNSLR